MRTQIKNGIVINPETQFCQKTDVLIENDKVISIGQGRDDTADRVIDARGQLVVPGLVDIHVHFRDPGFPQKETIRTGTLAAAAGGFTSVVCMPNTKPVIDNTETLQYVQQTSFREGVVKVYSSAAITCGIEGKQLTNMEELFKAGAVTFTDDGKTVMDPCLVYEAFVKAAALGVPVSSHCEEHRLVGSGSINRGKVSLQLGDPGISSLGEELIIARDILFAEETGTRLHIQHVSTARGVQLIRDAKARGVQVTAEAAPHHFSMTDDQVLTWGSMAKVNPPLRSSQDVEAVIAGLADNTLDAIATDHAPHTPEEKSRVLAQAPSGMVGLETSVGLVFTHLVHSGRLSLTETIAKMTICPARIMGLSAGQLEVGGHADITIIDPDKEWMVDPGSFKSRSKNMPYAGMKLKGKAILTMVNGQIVYDER